jgi:hypothetical protein
MPKTKRQPQKSKRSRVKMPPAPPAPRVFNPLPPKKKKR